jgi:two-component system, NarL family, response regulator NreC
MTIRILLAEHHAALRAALRSLLEAEPDLEVVGEAGDASELERLAGEIDPDVVVLDIGLLKIHDFEALRELNRRLPDARVLLLTDYADSGLVHDALVAGAAGCMLGQAAESTLVAATRAVALGYLHIQPSLMRALLTDLRPPPAWSESGAEDLTPREADVLRLLVQGCTNRQVAEELGVNVQAVESDREAIMLKLGLHGRAQLVRYAVAHQLGAEPGRQRHSHRRPLHQ